MPQLDLLLLYSQSYSGVVIFLGYLNFYKFYFPVISFFSKKLYREVVLYLDTFREQADTTCLQYLESLNGYLSSCDCIFGFRRLRKRLSTYKSSFFISEVVIYKSLFF